MPSSTPHRAERERTRFARAHAIVRNTLSCCTVVKWPHILPNNFFIPLSKNHLITLPRPQPSSALSRKTSNIYRIYVPLKTQHPQILLLRFIFSVFLEYTISVWAISQLLSLCEAWLIRGRKNVVFEGSHLYFIYVEQSHYLLYTIKFLWFSLEV